MKQLLCIPTLFVAMFLLSPFATTSESAKARNSALSSRAVSVSAKAASEPGKAVRKTAKPSRSTPDATKGKHLLAGAPHTQPPSIEIALVANAQAGTVALVDVASRTVLGTIDVNPAHTKSQGPGAPNYAQDTDVSHDGRTLYVSRGYLGDVAAFDIA